MALLIGGIRNGEVSARIDHIDLTSGQEHLLAQLPQAISWAAAAYVPTKNAVYVFGGSSLPDGTDATAHILRIDALTGAAVQVAASLPAALYSIAAVYHPIEDKVILIGGFHPGCISNAIYVFDPSTETVLPLSATLPSARYQQAVVYSPHDTTIYLFGGLDSKIQPTRTIDSLVLDPGGRSGTVSELATALLPAADSTQTAIYDSRDATIYVFGGSGANPMVLAFNPATGAIWKTRLTVQTVNRPAGERRCFPTPVAPSVNGNTSHC